MNSQEIIMQQKTKVRKETRHLRCNLTQDEFNEKAKQLAESNHNLRQLEEEKKLVTSDFGAKIAGAEAQISVLSNTVQSRYEYRMVPCEIFMHDPKNGKKRSVRTDIGETVGIEDMTAEELQEELALEEEAANQPSNPSTQPEPKENP